MEIDIIRVVVAPEFSDINEGFFIWDVVIIIMAIKLVLVKTTCFNLHFIYLIDENRLLIILSFIKRGFFLINKLSVISILISYHPEVLLLLLVLLLLIISLLLLHSETLASSGWRLEYMNCLSWRLI
jgi:hypothetical protein